MNRAGHELDLNILSASSGSSRDNEEQRSVQRTEKCNAVKQQTAYCHITNRAGHELDLNILSASSRSSQDNEEQRSVHSHHHSGETGAERYAPADRKHAHRP